MVSQNDNILLLGRDLRSISETQQQLVKAQIAVEKSHEERKEYDAHYRSIFSTAIEPIFILDVNNGNIKQANAAACALLGEDMDTLLTKSFSKFVAYKDKKDLIEKTLVTALHQNILITITRYLLISLHLWTLRELFLNFFGSSHSECSFW